MEGTVLKNATAKVAIVEVGDKRPEMNVWLSPGYMCALSNVRRKPLMRNPPVVYRNKKQIQMAEGKSPWISSLESFISGFAGLDIAIDLHVYLPEQLLPLTPSRSSEETMTSNKERQKVRIHHTPPEFRVYWGCASIVFPLLLSVYQGRLNHQR